MKKIFFIAIILGIFALAVLQSGLFSYSALAPDFLGEIYNQTHLEIRSGEVLVNGVLAKNGIQLKTGDDVEVQKGAEADIVFFDNSISRLSEGTKITLSQVEGEDSNKGVTRVKLKLSLGEVWSKVTKLVNNESTFEITTTDVAAAVRGSAFSIAVNESGNTSVMAVEHSLSLEKVRTSKLEKDESVVIIEGQKAVSQPRIRRAVAPSLVTAVPESSIRFKVEDIAENEKTSSWYQGNELDDKLQEIKVRRKIERAQEDLVGVLPGEFGYGVKSLRDQIFLVLANQPEAKAEVAAKIAERKIVEAQVLMRKGNDVDADTQLTAAQNLILQIKEDRDASTDPEVRAQIDAKIKRAINNSKQMANATTPRDRDYGTKQFIYDVELDTAPEDQKAEIQKTQYQNRIIEAYDLAKGGDNESAKKVVRSLAEDIKSNFAKSNESGGANTTEAETLQSIVVDPYLDATIKRIEAIESQNQSVWGGGTTTESTTEKQNTEPQATENGQNTDRPTANNNPQPEEHLENVATETIIFEDNSANQNQDKVDLPVSRGVSTTENEGAKSGLTDRNGDQQNQDANTVDQSTENTSSTGGSISNTGSAANTPTELGQPEVSPDTGNNDELFIPINFTTVQTNDSSTSSSEDWLKQKADELRQTDSGATEKTTVDNTNEDSYFFGDTQNRKIYINVSPANTSGQ
ncbi:MAG: DUF5667 domain-containing protein [Patescibacteria group bacterium]